jgi:aminomuconate-semialdehyde/2-hydroxymuconate-6-semialdehyde dehydrogenase
MSPQDFLNYIDGEFCSSQSKQTFPKYNPFNGELLGNVTASDAMDVIRAIQAAKRAQAEVEKWTFSQRAELLQKIASQLEAKADEYAFQEALHQGLPADFVKEKSVRPAIQSFRRCAEAVLALEKNKSLKIQHQPTGIISVLLSWNLSLRLAGERISAALAAGNICLVKVSELSPVTAQILGEVLKAVQAPKGLVQLIQGKGNEVGALLAAHPSIRAVNFVGKLSNAENIVKGALPQFKKVQIHAGTKNSCFMLADADYQNQMAKILQSFLIGQGQLAWNTTRLFILESAQKEFFEKIKEFLSLQKPATSPADKTMWWPLISAEALQYIEMKCQQLKAEGGKLISGGERAELAGYFFHPTVSLDLSNCSELQQEEVNGPLLIVTAVKYQHEMVKWSNTGYYGHSAVIWGSEEKALKIAEKLDVGGVSLNSWLPDEIESGHRQSSFGNMETHPWGRFYSDVKVLTGFKS